MRSRVSTGPVAGLVGVLVLLGGLAATTGLGLPGWLAGVTCGAGLAALLARALTRYGRELGPADHVTLARAVLVCGVTALILDSLAGQAPVAILVALSTVALLLDGVDGRIARRTDTASAFGARFDMEVDAFLIMVLSVYVAREWGWWVLALGLARYAFVAAGWVLPWLRGPQRPRQWARVVAAIVGVALTVAAADVLPTAVTTTLLVIALLLLVESFGRSVWGLWLTRDGSRRTDAELPSLHATVISTLALLLVWSALLLSESVDDLTPSALLRIPVEGLVFAVLVLVLPLRAARVLAIFGGLLLGVLTVLRLLDIGFDSAFDRQFHPVYDTAYAGSAVGLLESSVGSTYALAVLVGAGLLIAALIVLLPLCAVHLTRLAAAHRRSSIRVLALLSAVAVLTALSGTQPWSAGSIASTASSRLAYTHVTQVFDDLRAQQEFVRELEQDPFRNTPDDDLLTGLRGKDVLLVFVESYGRTALDLPVVESALDVGEVRLEQAGFASRSGFLTSPTVGGLSWLAHLTLQSGLWVDNQGRYDHLSTLDRLTLTDAFGRAGWRTVAVVPANEKDWSMGTTFYHYDQIWDALNLGYVGPRFGYAPVPDQYTLAAFQRLELDQPNRAPVMAEVDLISSHGPWVPLPRFVDWSKAEDSATYDPMPEQGKSMGEIYPDPDRVKAAYAESVAYTLDVLTSFVQRLHDPNVVLVVLGDHQPARIVSGEGASRDVPASIIAADPAVMDQVSDWGWQEGLRPDVDAPVWSMDAFRDRFLTSFGQPSPHP